MADQAPPEPPADAGQKQKKKRIQRDFQETARWEHDEHCEDDIVDGIRSELKIVNDRAGLKFMPGAHKGRDDRYGLFVTGNILAYQQGLLNQHNPQMSAVGALRMPVRGENRYNFYDNYSLHFQPSHSAAPQQRQGQICVLVV